MSDVSSVFGTSHLIYHISYVGRANTNVLLIRSVGKPLKEVHDVYWGSWRSCDSFAQFFGALGSYCWRTMTLSNTIPAQKQDFIHLCLTYPPNFNMSPLKNGWLEKRDSWIPFASNLATFPGFFLAVKLYLHGHTMATTQKSGKGTKEQLNRGKSKHVSLKSQTKKNQRGRHKIIYSLNCVH